MSIESYKENQNLSRTEIDPSDLFLMKNQMQMALAFNNLPPNSTPKEENAIMIARIEKNRDKFNIVFDELVRTTPSLFNDWVEDSNVVLNIIQQQMAMIPELPQKPNEKESDHSEEEKQAA